jgi:thiol:disulfide interchange protein DsbD
MFLKTVASAVLSTTFLFVFGQAAYGQNSKPGTFSPDLHADGQPTDIKPKDVVTWTALEAVENSENKIRVLVRLGLKQDWKIYASNLTFSGPSGMTLEGTTPPASRKFMDPISNKEVDIYEAGDFALTFTGLPRWTKQTFPLSVRYVGCTNVICLFPYTETVEVPFAAFIEKKTGKKQGAELESLPADAATLKPSDGNDVDLESKLAARLAAGNIPFFLLLAIVFAGGMLSNLTPCVYPMIPITLRLLGRQGASPYLSSCVYALGIVVSYSTLGVIAALSGGMFGSMMASKSFNVTFAILMFILGITMLGFGNFSKIQMLGNRLGTGAPSLRNTFLMGTGAGLVAAPCTGPILAALLAYTTKNSIGMGPSTALLFTYSLGFGLPYVFMGGAAAKVGKVKVSPLIQIIVKFLFAVVMFALSFYYLRIPFYGFMEGLRDNWHTIGMVTGIVGLILAAAWLIAPSLRNNKYASLVPSIILGIFVFSLSQTLTSKPKQNSDSGYTVTWLKTEESAFLEAKNTGKPLLIDMWAEWCEACKKMDATTFVDGNVLKELSQNWVTLKLDLTESNDTNDQIQEKYGLQGLPTLVLVPSTGDVSQRQNLAGYVAASTLVTSLQQFNKKAE